MVITHDQAFLRTIGIQKSYWIVNRTLIEFHANLEGSEKGITETVRREKPVVSIDD